MAVGRETVKQRHWGAAAIRRHTVAAVLFVMFPCVLGTAAQAAPATLHLTAIVYQHSSSERGTVFTSRERLYQGPTRVGEDDSRCVTVSRERVRCVGSYTLMRGTIQFAGTTKISNSETLAITGGTDAYKGARGTVLTEYNRAGTMAKETVSFN